MDKFFRIISGIFSPLIIPVYGIAIALSVTVLSLVPFGVRMGVVGMCAVFLFVMPALAVLVLYRIGRIKDPGLNIREERTLPYVIVLLCYALCAWYLYRISAPLWLVGFILGGLLTIVINLVINLKWKISGHMAAMGGLMGVIFFISVNRLAIINMTWIMIASILCAGLVATARLALNRHTPMQVLAGTVNGFACVYLCAWLMYLLQNQV